MRRSPSEKCALAVKPVVWSPNGYKGACGPPAASGFVADHGFGGEEWNNAPGRIWKKQRVFHAQSTAKLNEYAEHGNLALLMIAMHDDVQYIVGLACGVTANSSADMDSIADRFDLDAVGDEVWQVEAVRRLFTRRSSFTRFWKRGHQTLHFRCPKDLYHWFDDPVPIPKYPLGDKMVLVKRHGSYQGIRSEEALKLLGNALGDCPVRSWLIEKDFDEAFLSPGARKTKPMSKAERRRAYSSAAAVDSYERYIRECIIQIDPRHGRLEQRFCDALRQAGVETIEQNVSGIDALFDHPEHGPCVVELKPADQGETKYPIRHAVGQILEYRHFVAPGSRMLVVLGARPSDAELVYLKTISIACAWETASGDFEYEWH